MTMRPFYTLRSPAEQARLWRQSRPGGQIRDRIRFLESKGATYLAHVLGAVGPQNGRHVTNALPGMSWHQWGLAVDCFWLVGGRADWSTRRGGDRNGYRIYARQAEALGLTAGGHWPRFKDWPHVQAGSQGVQSSYTYGEVDAAMRDRFGPDGD